MSATGDYYGVEKFGDEWVAMYDVEQHLMGESFATEEEAETFVREDQSKRFTSINSFRDEVEKIIGTSMFENMAETGWNGSPNALVFKKALAEASDALTALHQEEIRRVIGEDEDPEPIHVSHFVHEVSCIPQLKLWARDSLRVEQRKRAGLEDGDE